MATRRRIFPRRKERWYQEYDHEESTGGPKMRLDGMISNKLPGKLIAFCGVDGAGKTTLMQFAKSLLEDRGIEYYATKMPSDRIREMNVFRDFHDSHDPLVRRTVSALALTILISGDRLIVQETEVIPALERGDWVLTDRYVFSGLACCDSGIIGDIAKHFIEPDLVFLAHASSDVVRARIRGRVEENDRYYDDEDTMVKIARFAQMAESNDFFRRVDTESSLELAATTVRDELARLIDGAEGWSSDRPRLVS
jgi:dTMP kinase